MIDRPEAEDIGRPEAEDIGGAINAVMKAIADKNEELGGALPRNYNSLEKPILRELLKILNRISRANINEDAFGKIYHIKSVSIGIVNSSSLLTVDS